MKESTKRNLINYNELAKDELGRPEVTDELRSAISWQIKNAAKARQTSVPNQQDIYTLQKGKQKTMMSLKKELKNLDEPSYRPEKLNGQYEVKMEGKKFFVLNEAGEKLPITLGEILTDGEWGIEYYLDPDTIPKIIRKKYLIQKNKIIIRRHFYTQVALDEAMSFKTPAGHRMVYKEILKRLEGNKKEQGGIIAEVMVKNFFKKLFYDSNLDIEIIDTDPEQDVNLKIDFIIRRRSYRRGVDVQTAGGINDDYEDFGVQFSTNTDQTKINLKENQLEKNLSSKKLEEIGLTDVVLVIMPLGMVINDFNRWKGDQQKPGGPDKSMPDIVKRRIFEKVLRGIFTKEEIILMLLKTELASGAVMEDLENTISRSGVARLKSDLFGNNPDIKVENLLRQTYEQVTKRHRQQSISTGQYPIPYEEWCDLVLKSLK